MGFWPFVVSMYIAVVLVISIWSFIEGCSDENELRERYRDSVDHRSSGDILAGSIFTGILTGIPSAAAVILILSLFWSALFMPVAEPYGEPTVVELQSLGDLSATGGTLYLGTGTLAGERSINYTTKEANGRVHLENVRLEDSEVYEIEGKTPTVTIQEWAHMRQLPWGDEFPDNVFHRYIFVIPPGSTTNDFVIDNS